VTIVPLLEGQSENWIGGVATRSLVHDRIQGLDDVKIDFIVVIPNTCFPPRDRA